MHGRAGGRRRRFLGGFAVAAVAVALEFALLDALQAGELFAVAQGDQRDALRGTALLADLRHARADPNTAGRDQHHLVVVVDQHRADHLAIALGSLDRDHALAAAAVARLFDDKRGLAEAGLGRGQTGLPVIVRRTHALDSPAV